MHQTDLYFGCPVHGEWSIHQIRPFFGCPIRGHARAASLTGRLKPCEHLTHESQSESPTLHKSKTSPMPLSTAISMGLNSRLHSAPIHTFHTYRRGHPRV